MMRGNKSILAEAKERRKRLEEPINTMEQKMGEKKAEKIRGTTAKINVELEKMKKEINGVEDTEEGGAAENNGAAQNLEFVGGAEKGRRQETNK